MEKAPMSQKVQMPLGEAMLPEGMPHSPMLAQPPLLLNGFIMQVDQLLKMVMALAQQSAQMGLSQLLQALLLMLLFMLGLRPQGLARL